MPVTTPAGVTGLARNVDGNLAVHSLSYRYPGAATNVIEDFSHTFRAGSLTAIVAPSGAGKSTLLSLLGLLLRPSSGTIVVGGITAQWQRRGPLTRLRVERYAWILQNNTCLEARSALDNVAIGLLSQGATMPTARRVAAGALATVGLEPQAHMAARHLSGGEQQRMTIARALLADRPYLLADEPTGNLDRANSAVVFQALRACAQRGAAVIVATHDLQATAAADEVVDLTAGVYSR